VGVPFCGLFDLDFPCERARRAAVIGDGEFYGILAFGKSVLNDFAFSS